MKFLDPRRLLSRFIDRNPIIKDQEGATAIEFGILALPFFLLLFGILELAGIFFVSSKLQNGVSEASRRVRTGEFVGDKDDLKDLICAQMTPGGAASDVTTCMDRLDVTVQTLGGFSTSVSFTDSGSSTSDVASTSGGDTVLLEAVYDFPLALPGSFTRMANTDSGNIRELKVVTAFKNEPF